MMRRRERIGLAVFSLLLRFLPRRLREWSGAELRELFATRQREMVDSGGSVRLFAFWMKEAVGLLVSAVAARFDSSPPDLIHAPQRRDLPMDNLLQDLRYVMRRLRSAPGMVAVALLSLGLAIGANTVLFSAVSSLLLRPLPAANPDRLVNLFTTYPERGGGEWSVSLPNALDPERRTRAFENLAAYQSGASNVATDGEPQRAGHAFVQRDLFDVVGVAPAVGRGFTAEEDVPNAPDRVVVLGNAFWREQFNGEPALGKTLGINGRPHTIVGVMPEGFDFPFGNRTAIYTPLRIAESSWGRGSGGLAVIARLRDGVTVESARRDIDALAKALETEFPKTNAGMGYIVSPVSDVVYPFELRLGIYVLFGAVAVVLVIACFNLANLMMARGLARENETAIRLALGGARSRIVRLDVFEGLMLGIGGGVVGVLFAVFGGQWLRHLDNDAIPRVQEVDLNFGVFAFTSLVSIVAGLIVGAAPALQGTGDLGGLMRDAMRGTRNRARTHARRAVVIAEVALSVILLASAGLLIRSFTERLNIDPGFDADRVLSARVALDASYRDNRTRADVLAFHQQVLDRLRAAPGVEAASAGFALPLLGRTDSNDFIIEDRPITDPASKPNTGFSMVTTDYFTTMGIPLRQGRSFDRRDTWDQPGVVVVSRAMAEKFWPGENAIGKRLRSACVSSSTRRRAVRGHTGER
jgi:putative ABC transport system permease protein